MSKVFKKGQIVSIHYDEHFPIKIGYYRITGKKIKNDDGEFCYGAVPLSPEDVESVASKFALTEEEKKGIIFFNACWIELDHLKTLKYARPICPNCGKGLEDRSCKLICKTPSCGYHVSCADIV
jgi:hypothetical protein